MTVSQFHGPLLRLQAERESAGMPENTKDIQGDGNEEEYLIQEETNG